jgi:hypothetical protein
MKKTLLLAAALACSGAVAQEKQVWACQMVNSTMLAWENNSWEAYTITPYNILFTINADNTGNAKRSDEDYVSRFTCTSPLVGDYYSCLPSSFLSHYLFSPDEGKLGISDLYGAISTSANRDSVASQIFNCTKF